MNKENILTIQEFIAYLKDVGDNFLLSSTDGYPRYSKEIIDFWGYCQDNNIFLDYNGPKERIYLRNKNISEMTISEMQKHLDAIFYGERFADGNIGSYIKSGRMLNLLEELVNRIENNDNK